MSEGRVNSRVPITPEVTARPTGNRAYMPDMTTAVDRIRRTHGTRLSLDEANASEAKAPTPEGDQAAKQPNVKSKAKKRTAMVLGAVGIVVLGNMFFGGEEEPTKSTATDPYSATTPKRPHTTSVPAATSANTPSSQPSQRASSGLSCNMTSVAPSIDKTGNIALGSNGGVKGVEATLSTQNAKNPKEIAVHAGIVVNNAIDKTNTVAITRNENGTYHIESPIPDSVYAVYAQEGSQSEICGAFKISGISPQSVSEFTVPKEW